MTIDERDALRSIKLLANSIDRIADSMESIEKLLQRESSNKREWAEDDLDRVPDFLRRSHE